MAVYAFSSVSVSEQEEDDHGGEEDELSLLSFTTTLRAMKEQDPSPPSLSQLGDTLFCEEQASGEDDNGGNCTCFSPFLVLLQERDWEDDELHGLFAGETEMGNLSGSSVSVARGEAVVWMVKVGAWYGFATVTVVVAVNYLDRFLRSSHFRREKRWLVQLAAVTCLSLAAKVEETKVPLLFDLQVEDAEFIFEAKTIQRMELLILSTLQWKMHPITPISFLDHTVRRLGFKTRLRSEFLRQCHRLLLAAVSDSRFTGYLPSVAAAAIMMRVISQVEPYNAGERRDRLLGVLKMSSEKVGGCYDLILELSEAENGGGRILNPLKRKRIGKIRGNPIGSAGGSLSSDCSNDLGRISRVSSDRTVEEYVT